MAATSLAKQLQKLKTLVKIDTDAPTRPITRPSILYDPREAADLDLDTLLNTALSGLEVLGNIDERFRNYKRDLFSHKSREVDRELVGIEENNSINATISSYLRLLSGHLQSPSAFKTLEYLVRRYKVHVYNIEELILCALPYHDTHAFVRIVQLIDFGNSRWKFLDGVNASGAPPPREVLVQQCKRDLGVLEVICNYATPEKKHQPSTPVISFCTAVLVEVLGSLDTVEDDIVRKILPFLNSGLKSGGKGTSDYKAGTLMIVGLLAKRTALAPKVVSGLVRSVAELAQADAQSSTDAEWLRLSIMAVINIVQMQSIETLPKKAVDILKEIKDLPGILSQLTAKFNIDRFLMLLLESLIDYSDSDSGCKPVVVSIIETVSIRGLARNVASRLLSACLRLSQKTGASELSDSGSWAKQILQLLNEKYPNELRTAVHDLLDDKKVQLKGEKFVIEALCKVLDGDFNPSAAFSDSRVWFALEHPKAEMRRAVLYNTDFSPILNGGVTSQRLVTVQDAIGRCLIDDDLSVVQAALSLDKLPELADTASLLETFKSLLQRCTQIIYAGVSEDLALAVEVAVSCLKHAVSFAGGRSDMLEAVATLIFPFLLVLPKTKVLNLKAQELAKEINWPFYRDLVPATGLKKGLKKKAGREWFSMMNMSTVGSLADVFSVDSEKFMPWLLKCCSESELSKTLFFLVLLQSFTMQKNDIHVFSGLYEACFAFLKEEWRTLKYVGDLSLGQESDAKVLDTDNFGFLEEVEVTNIELLNRKILVFALWRLVKAYILNMPANVDVNDHEKWICNLRDLYLFFAESGDSRHLFKEHRHYLVLNCKVSPVHFLSIFLSDQGISSKVQVESLLSFSMLCSQADEGSALQLLAGFPLVLVPLSSDIPDVRAAAMNYVEELSSMCSRVKYAGKKNGSSESWSFFIDELLSLLVQQKKSILSDWNFLPSFLASILSPSYKSLLVPEDVGKKFEKSTTEGILAFILGSAMKYPEYAKLRVLSLLKELGGAIVHVKDVESLLCELLQRRRGYHFSLDRSCQKLSSIDVEILCLLIEICSQDIHAVEDYLLPALWVDGLLPDDVAIVRPCITFLQKLRGNVYDSLRAEVQQNLFQQLVFLYHDANSHVQIATGDALLRLNISYSAVASMLDCILASDVSAVDSSNRKKKISKKHKSGMNIVGRTALSSLGSLLDVLLLKKDMENRVLLIEPLFQLLGKAFSIEWVHVHSSEERTPLAAGVSQIVSPTLCYIQQTLLLILEDIISSLPDKASLSNGTLEKFDATLLVDCARAATDVTTRNHVYSLFAAISKVDTDKILDHVPEILDVIGKSTVDHDDNHSKRVFEEFISTVVPCWLSKMDGTDKLLQIFVRVMPDISQHRRLSIVLHLLRTLGESSSMGPLFVLLFRSLVTKVKISSLEGGTSSEFISSVVETGWEYKFVEQICDQYTCVIWLPSLVSMLKQFQIDSQDRELFSALLFALKFILEKLQDPEFVFRLQSKEDMDTIQGALSELLVQVVFCWQLVDLSRKKVLLPVTLRRELKELVHAVAVKISKGMVPSAFFQGVIRLLVLADEGAKKKALQVLCEILRDLGVLKSKRERDLNLHLRGSWNHLDGSDLESFSALCLEILKLLDGPRNDINVSVRLAGISALEVLATKFPSNHTVFSKCINCIVRSVMSDDLAVVSCCLRTCGALISVLGPRALPELPQIMKNLFQKIRDLSLSPDADKESTEDSGGRPTSKDSVMLSVLMSLEALVVNLGAFLSPYLYDIMELLVLHPDYVTDSSQKLKSKADDVRKLLSEKVPVRLALPAMQNVYSKAIESGDLSVSTVFELLKNFVCEMDRSSVSGYHKNIFDLCILALDIRSQHTASLKNISTVEKYVIDAMIALTMKMTESMFKPLFISVIEWAESNLEEDDRLGGRNIRRAISFYGLVNKLSESHRSLFVPYFKYLLEGTVRYLTDEEGKSGHLRKKKKAKLQKSETGGSETLDVSALEKWHLRALVLSSLHKCFLYDTGTHKFLDSSRFHLLLKPIVSQLVVEPPASLEDHPDVPSVKDVDDALVSCAGQMAVTAGSDLLWKPLNYEVLMQTRSEMVRTRLLGLRIVKKLVENLKEEYLVLLAESIPFLAELLEDAELPVKTLAQEILKDLESMSGENLRQYF